MRAIFVSFSLLCGLAFNVVDVHAKDVDPILTAPHVSMQMVHDYVLSALKKRFASAEINDSADGNIEIRWSDSTSLKLGLTNLLDLMNADPAARQNNLDEFLSSTAAAYERTGETRLLTAEDIDKSSVAVVRNQSYLDELIARNDSDPPGDPPPPFWHPTRFVSRKLCGDLVIILMLDQPTMLSPLDGNEPMALIMGDDQLFQIALANTQKHAAHARFESLEESLTRIVLDDATFNSSIFVVDSFWRDLQRQRGGGAIVVAVPTRADIVFGSADQLDQVAALRDWARMSPAPYPLSRHLYRYDKGVWSELPDQ